MKIIIFAGGVGTRLWPVSRKNSPKQFEKIIGDKSTLQQMVESLQPDFPYADIYVQTGKYYETIVREQLPQLPKANFIFEPDMRDNGPAIGLCAAMLAKQFPDEPMVTLWSDHVIKEVGLFKQVLKKANEMIESDQAKFIFIGQKPRFANQNMGWIEVGEEIKQDDGIRELEFKKLRYRPKLRDAISFFENKNFVWNLGYFVTTPKFLDSLFAHYSPEMHTKLMNIISTNDNSEFDKQLATVYPTLEKISFDDAVLVKLKKSHVFVLSADLGWSDVGAWESLKEALSETQDENVTKGKVMIEDSRDSLIFNYNDQMVVGIDLNEMLVINTGDVILVCPKTSVPKIKKLVESLTGTPNEHLV